MRKPDYILLPTPVPPAEELVQLSPDVRVPKVFTAVLRYPHHGDVEIDIMSELGRSRMVAVRVSEVAGAGITGLSVAQTPITRLLPEVVACMALLSEGRGGQVTPAAMAVATAASRRRVSDERLGLVAQAAAAGGVKQVMAQENVGERQAFRLIKRASEVKR